MSLDKKRQLSRQLDEFQMLLKQEITLSQEILSQMTQQEYLLLIGEVEMQQQLETEVQSLVKQLQSMQKKRHLLMKEILEQFPLYEHQTLTDLLDPTDETDAETLIYLEKYQKLIHKITDQQKRNATLSEMIQKEGALDLSNQALHSQTVYDSQTKKPLLITIDYPNGQNDERV